MEIGAVGEEARASVGGVWEIAAVEVENWTKVKGKMREAYTTELQGVSCENMWELLDTVCEAQGEDQEGYAEEVRTADWPSLAQSRGVKNKKGKKVKFKGAAESERYGGGAGCSACFGDVASICAVPFASCCASPPGLEVCTVSSGDVWRKIGAREITIDSAAEESVCPKEWATEFGTKEVDRKVKFVKASGGVMGHYGERVANFKTTGHEAAVMSLTFQVSDVQKPLAAVRRIAEKGNLVQFGPRAEDNFIKNAATGMKIMMVKRGGSYVVPAELMVKDLGFTRRAQ
jgi:hypothetical protein